MVNGFGDPNAVSAAASELQRASAVIDDAHSLVKSAQPHAWRGEAAEAFTASAAKTLPRAVELSNSLRSASDTFSRYAVTQRDAQAKYENAQADFDRAADAVRSNPLDVSAVFSAAQARMSAFAAIGQLQQAAQTAASELRAASGEEADSGPWWDPFGWFTDEEEPDERVSEDIMDEDAFDPDAVAQGNIGDCFMLSTVVSLLETEEGQEFIREHVRWDEDEGGYWVTLYRNGEPVDVFVDKVYSKGARQDGDGWWIFGGDKPSIAAIYEAAIAQELGYDYLEGGVAANAMELITGEPAEVIENTRHGGLSSGDIEQLREVVDDGGQVVLSSPRNGTREVTVTAPDGSTREVEIVSKHAYVVTRIEPDGSVWMRNPWGPDNGADGGGEFRVEADDVRRYFWRSSSTNITE